MPGEGARIERVVLVGFMCSGKSTVGAALARRLEWRFLDFDAEIERREGRPIAVVVETEGEDSFRAREAALTEEVAGARGVVVSPGGGWILQPGLLERLRPGTLAAWLRVGVEETVRRLRADPGLRPFRDHPDPRGLVSAMLEERETLYRRADVVVPADGRSAEDVAFEIELLVRTRNGAIRE